MADFDAKLKKLQNLLSAEEECCTELGKIQDDISGVRNNLTFQLDVSATIKSQLGRIHTHVGTQKKGMRQLKKGLNSSIRQYDRTEKRICDAAADGKISLFEAVKGRWHQFRDGNGDIIYPLISLLPGGIMGPCVAVADLIMSDDMEWNTDFSRGWKSAGDIAADLIQDKVDNATEDLEKEKKWEKTNSGQWIKDKDGLRELDPNNPEDKKIIDQIEKEKPDKVATLYSAEAKKEGELWNAEGKVEKGCASASGSATAGAAEMHAEAYGGLYTVGSDGKKKLSPGFGAEVGGSITAFSAEGNAMLGDDDLGVYVSGDVTAGKVEAKAGVDVGLRDKEGKINPALYAGASAEAIAVEASAAIGAKVLGTDVKGNVGVNVGVGAHANVGIKDGVINLDVGASVGVGVSANLSIDVSGTIEKAGAVVSKAKSVFSEVSGSVGRFTQKVQKYYNW